MLFCGPFYDDVSSPLLEFGEVLHSNLRRSTGYPDLICRGFLQLLQANYGAMPRVGHDDFLPNPSQFIYHFKSTLNFTL
jgi:hypothetical protein